MQAYLYGHNRDPSCKGNFRHVGRLFGVNHKIVRKWVTAWKNCEGLSDKPRSGRPPKWQTEELIAFAKKVCRTKLVASCCQLAQLIFAKFPNNGLINERSLRDVMRAAEITSKMRPSRAGLTENHKARRLVGDKLIIKSEIKL